MDNKKSEIEKQTKEPMTQYREIDRELNLKFQAEVDEKTGKSSRLKLLLTDGTPMNKDMKHKFTDVFRNTTGTTNLESGLWMLHLISQGFSAEEHEDRLNIAASLLPALEPQDATEAMLLGQYLTLNDSGNSCLRKCHSSNNFFQTEKYGILASKMFAQANATMIVLTKYRQRGQQTVQVVHVYNQGQAIVAQNFPSQTGGEGGQKEND